MSTDLEHHPKQRERDEAGLYAHGILWGVLLVAASLTLFVVLAGLFIWHGQ